MGDTANPEWEEFKKKWGIEDGTPIPFEGYVAETLRELSLDEYIRITALELSVKSLKLDYISNIIARAKDFEAYIRGDE